MLGGFDVRNQNNKDSILKKTEHMRDNSRNYSIKSLPVWGQKNNTSSNASVDSLC